MELKREDDTRGLRWTLLVVVLLFGCAALGLPTPTTFNERLAAGYKTVSAVRTEAIALTGSGYLSFADASNVQMQADTARAGLDLASQTYVKDPTGASTKLTTTIAILTALQTYVASRRPAR